MKHCSLCSIDSIDFAQMLVILPLESADISDQFMIGSSLMVVPNFENFTEDITTLLPVYYPPENW